jgi:hypothetical protein
VNWEEASLTNTFDFIPTEKEIPMAFSMLKKV